MSDVVATVPRRVVINDTVPNRIYHGAHGTVVNMRVKHPWIGASGRQHSGAEAYVMFDEPIIGQRQQVDASWMSVEYLGLLIEEEPI